MAKPPTASEKRHMQRVREMYCLGCGMHPPNSAHHVTSDGFKRLSKDHLRVVPLCPDCHQHGPHAVHKIGTAVFNTLHGIDLLAEAERLANG